VRDGYEVMLISQDGTVIRQKAEGISRMGRATQGVRVMNLREDDRLSSIARVTEPQAVVDAGEEGDQPVEIDAVEPNVLDPVEDDEAAVETPEDEQPGDLEE
jgi:DNA gyrase subunit A